MRQCEDGLTSTAGSGKVPLFARRVHARRRGANLEPLIGSQYVKRCMTMRFGTRRAVITELASANENSSPAGSIAGSHQIGRPVLLSSAPRGRVGMIEAAVLSQVSC